ncbi:MAG: hypothetical protein ACK5LX_09475 [Oscillospiraceae bacterium]
MRRFWSLFLVLVLLATVFAGCAGDTTTSSAAEPSTAPSESGSEVASTEESASTEEPVSSEAGATADGINLEGYPIAIEPMTFTMMGMKHPIHGDWENLAFFKEMEKLTNISFTYDTPMAEVFTEKKNLAFNTGSYGEVLFGMQLTQAEQVKYGTQGILVPLEDYIEQYCPNLMEMLDTYPHVRASITAPDGHIYALPSYTTAPIAMVGSAWANAKFLEALEMTEADLPNTTDGFAEYLTRVLTEDPNGNGQADEIPWTSGDDNAVEKGDNIYIRMMPAFGILYRKEQVMIDGDTAIHPFAHENAKAFFTYANKLWSENLLDHDAFIQGMAEIAAKGANNQVGIAWHAIPSLIYGDMTNEEMVSYPLLPALTSPENTSALVLQENSGIAHGTFALTDKCTNIPAMLRWVDYLYSEEGSLLIHYGPKGMFYEDAENGLWKHVERPGDTRNNEEFRGGEVTPDCGLPLPKYVRPTTEGNWDDPFQQFRIKSVDEKLAPYMQMAFPDMYFTEEEQQVLDEVATDIQKYARENGAKLITGEMSIDNYDQMMEGLNALGLDRYLTAYQTAYDRWKTNQ